MKFVKALRDYLTDENGTDLMLNFKKNDIIKIISEQNSPARTDGFLIGVLNNRKGFISNEFVRPITRGEALCDLKNARADHLNLLVDSSDKNHLHDFDFSSSERNIQDGHFSMMEFAMSHFRKSIDK